MKATTMLQMLMAGFFLSFTMAACAGSDTMAHDNTMQEKQMGTTEMEKGKMKMDDGAMKSDTMKDDAMKSDTMKGDAMKKDTMQDASHDKPMMKPESMKDDTMMKEHPTAMLAGSDGHHAAGKVSFVEEMGKTALVLSDIKVDKVPDGHVYLAKNGDRKQGVDLGILKQFTGKVAFALPADADPAAYDSVIIYCEKYNVEIGRAKFAQTM